MVVVVVVVVVAIVPLEAVRSSWGVVLQKKSFFWNQH
jgi:hypothetical protein